jgi:putative inorganic carbon (hco3(-)) transporter
MVGVLVPLVISFGFAMMPELKVAALVVGLLTVMVIFAFPFVGLVAFVGLLYTRPEELIPALTGMRLTLIISMLTFIALFYRMLIRHEAPVKTPVNYLMAGFSLMIVLTSATTGAMGEAIEYTLKIFVLVLCVLNIVRTPGRYHAFVTALIFFTGYLAAYSIYLYHTGGALKYLEGVQRGQATGIFSDPNDLAAAVVGGLALSLTRIATARSFSKLFYVFTTLVMIWAIFLTNSRGGLLALLLVLFGYFLAFSKKKGQALVLAGAVCLLFLAAAPSRMRDFDSGEESANSRFHFWANGIDMLSSNPLMGVGFNEFANNNEGNFTAHNSFVLCFAELGLPGYFCWMGILYYCFRRPPKREEAELLTDTQTDLDRRELLGARLALAGFLAAIFWISRTYIPTLFLLMCLPITQQLAAGGRTSLFQLTKEERWQDWGRIAALCLGSILFIKMMVMVLQ